MTYLTNQIEQQRDPYTVPVNLGPDNSFDTAYIYKAEQTKKLIDPNQD